MKVKKTIKTITILSVLALLIESIVFFAVDKYYKSSLLNTKTTEIKVLQTKKAIKNIDVAIPSDAANLSASYDGKYISYSENNVLNVVNTNSGVKNTVSVDKDNSIAYSRWLPDIESIILCENKLSEKNNVEIYTYNADNNITQTATDDSNKPLQLELNSTKDKVECIELSTAMQVFYAKISKSNNTNYILCNDVNGQTSSMLNSQNIGNIKIFNNKSGLVYENLDDNVINFTQLKNVLYSGSACLLNIDNNDNVYIGIVNNNKVTKILYGQVEQKTSAWNSINLDNAVDKDYINITAEGKIYIINSLEHYVLDKTNNKKINYTGSLLKITSKDIMYIDNGLLKIKPIN